MDISTLFSEGCYMQYLLPPPVVGISELLQALYYYHCGQRVGIGTLVNVPAIGTES